MSSPADHRLEPTRRVLIQPIGRRADQQDDHHWPDLYPNLGKPRRREPLWHQLAGSRRRLDRRLGENAQPQRELPALAAIDDYRPAARVGRRAYFPAPGEARTRFRAESFGLRNDRVVDHLDRAPSSGDTFTVSDAYELGFTTPVNVTLLTFAPAGAVTTSAAAMQTMRRTSLGTTGQVSRAPVVRYDDSRGAGTQWVQTCASDPSRTHIKRVGESRGNWLGNCVSALSSDLRTGYWQDRMSDDAKFILGFG